MQLCLHNLDAERNGPLVSLKAEDGLLYPLEKGFFFLPKPPTLILHEEIDYVEFERHGAGGSSASPHYFDLFVKLKNDQEHLFRNIQRNEYHNLFDFISEKGLKILNLEAAQTTNSVAAVLEDAADDAVDPHLERIKNAAGGEESDEEDEDFVIEKDDGGSPTDDSGGEESDASDNGAEKEKPAKKETKKEAAPAKAQSSKKRSKDGDEEGSKEKRPKKKKDPNAPKRALSGFMFFSNSEREIMTNGIFKSPVHRVVTNPEKDRISIAMFHALEVEKELKPADGLVGEGRPKLYKTMTTKEYLGVYFQHFVQGTRAIEEWAKT